MTRLPGLDLLRSIAIVWVMCFHTFLIGGLGPDWEWLTRFGWAGVDIFFVLSGFLIGSQWLQALRQGKRPSLGHFYWRRAWRILPAFAAVLGVYLAFPVLREEPHLEAWWQFATFTLNLFIDYGQNRAFSHAWSLCVEEHFYLVFPLLALWMMRRPSTLRFGGLCALLVLGGVALRGAVWLHMTATQPERPWFIEDLYYPTWSRLDGLLLGVMLAALRTTRPQAWQRLQQHANLLALAGLALAGLALMLFRQRTGLAANTVGWPLLSLAFGLLVLAASAPRSWLSRLALPGTGWLAAVSYSLYLSHKLAMHAVHTWITPALPVQGLALFPVYAAVILAVGAALHYAVERPGLALRDRLRPQRRETLSAATR
ncbi:MAG: acyltransferase [Burkholderiales bacterium]|nr:MAG: acyltransferase [Burkholderiales bacterium]